jgi:hypothetical protein
MSSSLLQNLYHLTSNPIFQKYSRPSSLTWNLNNHQIPLSQDTPMAKMDFTLTNEGHSLLEAAAEVSKTQEEHLQLEEVEDNHPAKIVVSISEVNLKSNQKSQISRTMSSKRSKKKQNLINLKD